MLIPPEISITTYSNILALTGGDVLLFSVNDFHSYKMAADGTVYCHQSQQYPIQCQTCPQVLEQARQ